MKTTYQLEEKIISLSAEIKAYRVTGDPEASRDDIGTLCVNVVNLARELANLARLKGYIGCSADTARKLESLTEGR